MKKVLLISILLCTYGIMQAQQVFSTFQNASMVIGQPNFTTKIVTINDSVTCGPSSMAISSKGMLVVGERYGNSVKIWNSLPTRNGQPSNIQISLPTKINGVSWSPDGNKLIAVGDNRIYIWNSIPTANNQLYDVMSIGFNEVVGSVVTPDGKLLVSEYGKNRVLVWNSIPNVNNTTFDYVIGQPNSTLTSSGAAADKLFNPWGIALSPKGKLLIADASNHRVVIYDSIPETYGDKATVVIGQSAFLQSSAGQSDFKFNQPFGVTVTVDGKVAISEFVNNRVLIFDSVPESNYEKATVVIGQPNFNTVADYYPTGIPAANNMLTAYAINSDLNGRLFLSGRDMYRIMVFGELPTDSADLAISIEKATEALCNSSTLIYRMKIINNGSDTAMNVVATTAFPIGFKLNNFDPVNGEYNKASGYWEISSILPADSAILILTGLVDTGMAGNTITTYANIINSSALDTNLLNNGASIQVIISSAEIPSDPVANNIESCFGDSAILTATGAGTLYWYANEFDLVSIDTGTTFTTGPLENTITFYVELVDYCSSANRIPVTVMVKPVSASSYSGTICSGELYSFGAQTLTESGVYTNIVSAGNGCDSTITLTLTVNPVSGSADSYTMCDGESYYFNNQTLTESGIYTKVLPNIYGCDSTITLSLTVKSPVNTEITENVNVLSANEVGGEYQWILCEDNIPINGETSQTFTVNTTGNYAVIVSSDGCSDTSSCYNIMVSGIVANELNSKVSVYPIPVNDFLTLDLGNEYSEVNLSVFSTSGKEVKSASYSNIQLVNLEVSDLQPGVYYIQINTPKGKAIVKMLK